MSEVVLLSTCSIEVDPGTAGVSQQEQRLMVPGCHARYINPSSLRSCTAQTHPVIDSHGELVPIRRTDFQVHHRAYI